MDVSLDTTSQANGGDFGWIPQGVLPYDATTFALNVGQVSDPVAVNPASPTTTQYLLFMVSEKSPSRPIDANSTKALQANALSNWIAQEVPNHSIVLNYDFNNTVNQAWVNWQLTKAK